MVFLPHPLSSYFLHSGFGIRARKSLDSVQQTTSVEVWKPSIEMEIGHHNSSDANTRKNTYIKYGRPDCNLLSNCMLRVSCTEVFKHHANSDIFSQEVSISLRLPVKFNNLCLADQVMNLEVRQTYSSGTKNTSFEELKSQLELERATSV